jgi:hypothetical protein
VAGTEEVVTGNGGVTDAGAVIALPSSVTAPVRPMALPFSDAPVPNDTDASATTSPTITADVLIVADDPTNQITFLASAPLVSRTVAPTLIVKVEEIWNMKFPFPLRIRVPPTDKSKEPPL